MSYTTLAQVASMYPTFQRGVATQKPSDTYIQQFIDDVAGELDAILQRRGFPPAGQTFAQFIAGLSLDAANVLEKINRYGAAAQLGEALATFGLAGARDLAKVYRDEFDRLKHDLDARDDKGKPLPSGPYDKLFDPQARTETAEAAFKGIAGADQPAGGSPGDAGSSAAFGKFDKRGT